MLKHWLNVWGRSSLILVLLLSLSLSSFQVSAQEAPLSDRDRHLLKIFQNGLAEYEALTQKIALDFDGVANRNPELGVPRMNHLELTALGNVVFYDKKILDGFRAGAVGSIILGIGLWRYRSSARSLMWTGVGAGFLAVSQAQSIQQDSSFQVLGSLILSPLDSEAPSKALKALSLDQDEFGRFLRMRAGLIGRSYQTIFGFDDDARIRFEEAVFAEFGKKTYSDERIRIVFEDQDLAENNFLEFPVDHLLLALVDGQGRRVVSEERMQAYREIVRSQQEWMSAFLVAQMEEEFSAAIEELDGRFRQLDSETGEFKEIPRSPLRESIRSVAVDSQEARFATIGLSLLALNFEEGAKFYEMLLGSPEMVERSGMTREQLQESLEKTRSALSRIELMVKALPGKEK